MSATNNTPERGTQNMNKKTGYTIAGITAAIIAACSFMPAPDDNPPLASQPAPQATTANTEWTPKTARQAAAEQSLRAEQAKTHKQAQARGEETATGLTMITAAHTCNRKAEQQAAAHGVKWNGNPDIDLQLHKIIGKDTFSIVYGATVRQPGASKLPVTVHCLVTGTESSPHVTDLNINPQQ